MASLLRRKLYSPCLQDSDHLYWNVIGKTSAAKQVNKIVQILAKSYCEEGTIVCMTCFILIASKTSPKQVKIVQILAISYCEAGTIVYMARFFLIAHFSTEQ
jgi:hypothetical protein|uniref:Uncharacterized protein n=1 Tax=Zea mays TaxID=4577 RepID=A0A804PUC2_MAIZE